MAALFSDIGVNSVQIECVKPDFKSRLHRFQRRAV